MSKDRKTIVTLFPVGNGDMTLIALADNAEIKILIDHHTITQNRV